ncbi:hypothetical protein H072_8316 [Dactylellina haptotyla CBS 200.50]|uniref:Uncharacterized protein n=1 Tax=Dactylellina haptotyla (strain CBS 200.50) TaxID=1284197 RepID=S8BRZ2_DACHA|nr:hypothetical protein H072_8316 [Dactylellina haptotyla CBS 200.50]
MPGDKALAIHDAARPTELDVHEPPCSSPLGDCDITRSYLLDAGSIRNYGALVEQLLEDHQRPQRTKVHMDVNLSVDLDLTPEVYGDLHLSMLCVTVKRKPWEEDVIGRDGRRIAGTVLRIADGRGALVHHQVVGFESFGEWWWVASVQLRELARHKLRNGLGRLKEFVERIRVPVLAMILALPTAILLLCFWRLCRS